MIFLGCTNFDTEDTSTIYKKKRQRIAGLNWIHRSNKILQTYNQRIKQAAVIHKMAWQVAIIHFIDILQKLSKFN